MISIYALRDPFTLKIRYIGQTSNLRRRYWQHLKAGKLCQPDTYIYRWISNLLSKNEIPQLIILEEVEDEFWEQAEISWIEYALWIGWPITNTAPGGQTNYAIHNSSKSHCPYGHEYSDDNTYIIPITGSRSCRTCKKDRQKASIERYRKNSEKRRMDLKSGRLDDMIKSNKEISEWIRSNRFKMSLSQKQLANKIGVSQSSIFYWEQGYSKPIEQHKKQLEKIFGEENVLK